MGKKNADKPEKTGMNHNVKKIVQLGKIPDMEHITRDLFDQYDELIQQVDHLTYEDAKHLVGLFADDNLDLNWALLHLIESVDDTDTARYRELIAGCNNDEFKEILTIRMNNYLDQERSLRELADWHYRAACVNMKHGEYEKALSHIMPAIEAAKESNYTSLLEELNQMNMRCHTKLETDSN